MKKQKVFVLFSHLADDMEYEILLASTDAGKILEKWTEFVTADDDFWHDSPLTAELIESRGCLDSTYQEDNRRYVIDSFEVEIPESKEMYGVLITGDENMWLADMHSLAKSKEEAIDFIMNQLKEWEITDYLEDYRESLEERNSMVDPYFMHWDIIQVNVD